MDYASLLPNEKMKYEWKKSEKNIYNPKEIQYLEVEQQTYLTIKGAGDPNKEDFATRIEALYALAYAIRMAHKSDQVPEDYFEYTVYPLEGVWSTSDIVNVFDKSKYIYTIMIRQPKFVNEKVFLQALERVKKKKPNLAFVDELRLEVIEDGPSLQMIHIGSYDDESKTFEKMKEYMKDHQLERQRFDHREIYLSDARKIEPALRKTILRYFISK